MNMKRIARWSIVLFLLLALPGLTAALAQGQEPVKQLPVVTEIGESPTVIPWVDSEHNPNNSVEEVTWKPYISDDFEWGGKINSVGDVDYWAFEWAVWKGYESHSYETSLPILIDIEAQSIGSPIDTYICLYSDDGFELGCNDDTDTLDSMLFYNIEPGRFYYLKVSNLNGANGSDAKYQVLISVPMLISAAAGGLGTGNVAGIPFQSGDILAWSDFNYGSNQHQEKWVMLFDLSDLGVNGNVTNVAAGWRNSDYLLLGFAANATLPGISGSVTPWEVVLFDPSRIGPVTQGAFQRWWNGKQQGLTLAAEKPDAIDWPEWNGAAQLRVSTTGTAKVTGLSGATTKLFDEDVGLWNVGNGRWTLDFDGSRAEWGIGGEDVMAMSFASFYVQTGGLAITPESPNSGVDVYDYFLVLQGTATLVNPYNGATFNVNQKDIVEFREVSYPELWVGVEWHGPDHGWNYNIDAIDYLAGDWY